MSATARRVIAATFLVLTVAACSGPPTDGTSASAVGGHPAPVTLGLEDLPGTTVDLVVDQTLTISTGDAPVDGWSAQLTDPDVAAFTPGRAAGATGTATLNPGIVATATGTSMVTLTADRGTAEPVSFTVRVSDS